MRKFKTRSSTIMSIRLMVLTLIALILAVVLIKILHTISVNVGKEVEKYENIIGVEVIFKKDTLTVVDYSILNEHFVLSNGHKIHFNMLKQLDTIARYV